MQKAPGKDGSVAQVTPCRTHDKSEWSFCPKCGTQVFWVGDQGSELDLFAGTLDDTTVFQPAD